MISIISQSLLEITSLKILIMYSPIKLIKSINIPLKNESMIIIEAQPGTIAPLKSAVIK